MLSDSMRYPEITEREVEQITQSTGAKDENVRKVLVSPPTLSAITGDNTNPRQKQASWFSQIRLVIHFH